MSEYILQCNNLTKSYGMKIALNNVSLTLKRGSIVGFLGPNGSGKTTFIKTVNGLLTPNSGTVFIDGMSPGFETKKIVSYLPDRDYLADNMRVREALDMFEDFYGDFDREKAAGMIDNLQINPADKFKTLSKGNREKVQLILVMSRKAQLYLLDEPIGGVDPATRDYILNTIIRSHSPESTVVISTHLISDVENILDEVVFVREGSIVLHKDAEEMRQSEGKTVDEVFREVFRCWEN